MGDIFKSDFGSLDLSALFYEPYCEEEYAKIKIEELILFMNEIMLRADQDMAAPLLIFMKSYSAIKKIGDANLEVYSDFLIFFFSPSFPSTRSYCYPLILELLEYAPSMRSKLYPSLIDYLDAERSKENIQINNLILSDLKTLETQSIVFSDAFFSKLCLRFQSTDNQVVCEYVLLILKEIIKLDSTKEFESSRLIAEMKKKMMKDVCILYLDHIIDVFTLLAGQGNCHHLVLEGVVAKLSSYLARKEYKFVCFNLARFFAALATVIDDSDLDLVNFEFVVNSLCDHLLRKDATAKEKEVIYQALGNIVAFGDDLLEPWLEKQLLHSTVDSFGSAPFNVRYSILWFGWTIICVADDRMMRHVLESPFFDVLTDNLFFDDPDFLNMILSKPIQNMVRFLTNSDAIVSESIQNGLFTILRELESLDESSPHFSKSLHAQTFLLRDFLSTLS